MDMLIGGHILFFIKWNLFQRKMRKLCVKSGSRHYTKKKFIGSQFCENFCADYGVSYFSLKSYFFHNFKDTEDYLKLFHQSNFTFFHVNGNSITISSGCNYNHSSES